MQYKLMNGYSSVVRTDDAGIIATVPPDDANRDWQEYQAWLAEGNEPLPADG